MSRLAGVRDAGKQDRPKNAKHEGQPATANRYVGGAGGSVYSSIVTGYDDAYRPLGTTIRIPAAEAGLAGDWTTATAYNVDGSVASTTYPAVGGLAAETVTTGYDTTV